MGRILDRAYALPLGLVALHIAAMPLRVNHDCAEFLIAGRILASGGLPFIDVVDANPPLVMYVSAIPALLERVIPLHAATIYNSLVLALAAASTETLRRLLRRPEIGLERGEAALVALLWGAATLSIDLSHQLGQRDHLFMLVFFPFLLLRWVRWEGGSPAAGPATVLGAATGLCACFRPSLLVLILAPEIALALARRRARPLLSPETAALAAAGLAYGLHFLLLPGAVREAIFERWGPLIARGYSVFDARIAAVVGTRTMAVVLGAIALPAILKDAARPFAGAGFWRLARALAPLTALATALYVLERKEWPYRLHPAFGGATLLLALGVVAALRRLGHALGEGAVAAGSRPVAWRLPAASALAACALLLGAWPSRLEHIVSIDPRCDEVAVALERYSRPGDRILFLSTGVTPAHPALLQTGRRPATRFLNLFPIAILHTFPDAAAERRFLGDLLGDVAAANPEMVFVDAGRDPGLPSGFDMARWIDERGLTAILLGGHHPVGRFGQMEVYARGSGTPRAAGGAR